MKLIVRIVACMLALVFAGTAQSAGSKPARPLAHAHNDYEHVQPLLDALALDFDSVEADVHLVGGQLLVAHDRNQVRPDRTLQALYLNPLAERVRKNGGWVKNPGRPLLLLIDVKSEADPTCQALHAVLKCYATMLTSFRAGEKTPGAITVVISGNRSAKVLAAESPRYASLDGRIEELETETSADLMPLISADWQKAFTWRGEGKMPEGEREKLSHLVARAHAQGRRLRFWNTPDRTEFWETLSSSRVDLIGADDLGKLRAFLDSK